MWCITGDKAYAKITLEIINAWSSALQEISGADAVLCAGLAPFKLVNAAELMRHSGTGWSDVEARAAGEFFQHVLRPVLIHFAPFANGNWDTAALKTLVAIAIYNNDRELFEIALNYYLHGCGDGCLPNYIYPGGQLPGEWPRPATHAARSCPHG